MRHLPHSPAVVGFVAWDMIFHQYFLDCLSQMSYLIGDETSGRAVVVDPRRDVSDYLADAAAAGLTIERIIETHCHADFLSGHLELAATGAVICYGDGAQIDFPVELLSDGQCIDLGDVRLEIRSTPGHTPESISIVVYEHRSDPAPMVSSRVTHCSSAMSVDRICFAPLGIRVTTLPVSSITRCATSS